MSNQIIRNKLLSILETNNPCGIKSVEGEVTCNDGAPCCKGCDYLTDRGCSKESMGCKFYFCKVAWANFTKETQSEIIALGNDWEGELKIRHDFITHRRPPFLWG